MSASKGPEGDAERQKEIDALPENVDLVFDDGEEVTIPFRAAAQAADDDWRRFRDSPIGKMMLSADLEEEEE